MVRKEPTAIWNIIDSGRLATVDLCRHAAEWWQRQGPSRAATLPNAATASGTRRRRVG